VQQAGRTPARGLPERVGAVPGALDELCGLGQHLTQQRISGISPAHAGDIAARYAQPEAMRGRIGAERHGGRELTLPERSLRVAGQG